MTVGTNLEQLIKTNPDYLKKCIIPLDFITSNPTENPIGRWERWGLDPIYMRLEKKCMPSSAPDFEPSARKIFSDQLCEFTLVRTGIHLAIPAAAVLGAKKIILVGCSHRIMGNVIYAHKGQMGINKKKCNSPMVRRLGRMRRDLIQLSKTFRGYNVEVIRHRFDQEKNKFVFEEIIGESISGEE